MSKIRVLKPVEQYTPQARTEIPKTNFLFGLLRHGTRIVRSSTSAAATERVLYTVPAGKVFFLNTATMQLSSDTLNGSDAGDLYFNERLSANLLMTLQLRDVTATLLPTAELSLSFPIPFMLTASETLKCKQGATTITSKFTISGYEIDASLLPNFV